MKLLVSHHATFFPSSLRCKSEGSCQISFPASERAMLDSDRRWVLTEAASEPPGNLPYAENLCGPLKQMQRTAEKRYSLLMRLSENPGMATMAATLWTETDSSRWGLPRNRFNVGDLVAFLVGFAHLMQHILSCCIHCILIAHDMLHKDQQLFSMAQWYYEGFKIQG